MPVYKLPEELIFPPPEDAEPDGLLAVGGDLSLQRLVLSYRMGIFPWYAEGTPILWWSPDPRLVLDPAGLKVSKSLRRAVNGAAFTVTMDQAFGRVIRKCAAVERPQGDGTWIVDEMVTAYEKLHAAGLAHSVEAWQDGQLAGGLYGVSLGKAFFGESMFAEKRDASKVALVYLAGALQEWGIGLLDCQVTTGHLLSMGAVEIPRHEFLERLRKALEGETLRGKWRLPEGLTLPGDCQR